MMQPQLPRPAFRFERIQKLAGAGKPPSDGDPRMLALYASMTDDRANSTDDVEFAYRKLYLRPFHRTAMEAFLIADATPELVANNLKIPLPVVHAYKHLFFDTAVFESHLDVLQYAESGTDDTDARTIMQAAVVHGLQYVQWYYVNHVDLTTREVARRMMTDAYFRGISHRGTSLTSSAAKEAYKWMSMATKNAETLERLDPQRDKSAAEQIRIILERKDDTFTPETSPVPPEDVLH